METKKYKFGKKEVKLPEKMSIKVTRLINKIRFEANLQLLKLKKEYKGLEPEDVKNLESELFVQVVFERLNEVMSAIFPELSNHDWESESADDLMEVINDFFGSMPQKVMK